MFQDLKIDAVPPKKQLKRFIECLLSIPFRLPNHAIE
jgi:hypothetical protein